MHFPRILVVTSNNFNLVTGGGITLTNLFHGWPAGRIANLHEDSLPPDDSVCRIFYRLSGREIRAMWHLPLFASSTSVTTLPASNTAVSRMARISRVVFGDGVPRTFKMSDELERWLIEFQPELIYSFLGSMAQIRVTTGIMNTHNAPLAIHIMDDWPAVIYRHGFIAPILRRTVMREFRVLLESATVRLGICDEMCEDYQRRFGFKFLAFHNAIDIREWQQHARKNWEIRTPFVIRYAGSVVQEAQRNALREICLAVRNLRAEGYDVEMSIHSPAIQRAYLTEFVSTGVRLTDPPEPHSIAQLLSAADLLVLPFNFDGKSAEYMRLSMPTKIPAYMASGTPILVYGPDSLAPVRYAKTAGWAYVITDSGVDNVQAALKALITDSALRELHARRAQSIAAERHDSRRVRAAFQSALAHAARKLVYA